MLDDINRALHELEQIQQAVRQRPGATGPELLRRAEDAADCLVRVKDRMDKRAYQERQRRATQREGMVGGRY